ncbi:MAG TPA: hypothetical protein VHT72_04185 [Puia sp.]|nr:hypothetical protein [Puia sp.]
MKKFKVSVLIFILIFFIPGISLAQVEKNKLILSLGYYNDNNQIQYLKGGAKSKIDGKYLPVGGIHLSFYISSENPSHLLGKASTDDKGQAILMIPPSAKDEWVKSSKQTFLIVSDSSNLYDGTNASIDLTKARIKIDTAEDKKINVTLVEQKDSAWIPVSGVDMKIAIKRLGGDLNVSEAPTYTTDSLGMAQADFTYVKLPGDSAGNLILIATVEDNDMYGNLTTEKTVPWGTPSDYISSYNTRSLFARRGWSPLWLIWMAYSITAGVWFILFYLFVQIRKIKKLGA